MRRQPLCQIKSSEVDNDEEDDDDDDGEGDDHDAVSYTHLTLPTKA